MSLRDHLITVRIGLLRRQGDADRSTGSGPRGLIAQNQYMGANMFATFLVNLGGDIACILNHVGQLVVGVFS
jgi:hypothetical protein